MKSARTSLVDEFCLLFFFILSQHFARRECVVFTFRFSCGLLFTDLRTYFAFKQLTKIQLEHFSLVAAIYLLPSQCRYVVHVHDDKAVLISEAENRNRWANKSACIRPNLRQASTFPNSVVVCASACAYSLGISKSARKLRHSIHHEKLCCVCLCVCHHSAVHKIPTHCHQHSDARVCNVLVFVRSFIRACVLLCRTLVKRCQPACRATFCSCIIQYMHVAMNVVSALCKNVASQIKKSETKYRDRLHIFIQLVSRSRCYRTCQIKGPTIIVECSEYRPYISWDGCYYLPSASHVRIIFLSTPNTQTVVDKRHYEKVVKTRIRECRFR